MSVTTKLRQFRYDVTADAEVSWRVVRAVNTASAVDEAPDLQLMKHLLPHMATCTLTMGTVQGVTDVDLLQLLRVYQLSLQFALWSQHVLKEQLVAAQQRGAVTQVTSQYVNALEKKKECLAHDNAQLTQERDTLRLTSANLNQVLGKYETRCRLLEKQLAVERERGDALQQGLQRQAETFHAQALASTRVATDSSAAALPAAAALPPIYIDAATGRVAWQRDHRGRARCPLCHQHAHAKQRNYGTRTPANGVAASSKESSSGMRSTSCTWTSRSSSSDSSATRKSRHRRRRGHVHASHRHPHRPHSRQRAVDSTVPMENEYVDWASFGRHLLALQQQQQQQQQQKVSSYSPGSPRPSPPVVRQNSGNAAEGVLGSARHHHRSGPVPLTVVPPLPSAPLDDGSLSSHTNSLSPGVQRGGPTHGGSAPSDASGVASTVVEQRFNSAGSLALEAKGAVDGFLQATRLRAESRGALGALADPGTVEGRLEVLSRAVEALTEDLHEQIADVMRDTEVAVGGLSGELAAMKEAMEAAQAEQRNLLQSAIGRLQAAAAHKGSAPAPSDHNSGAELEAADVGGSGSRRVHGSVGVSGRLALEGPPPKRRGTVAPPVTVMSPAPGLSASDTPLSAPPSVTHAAVVPATESVGKAALQRPPPARKSMGPSASQSPPSRAQAPQSRSQPFSTGSSSSHRAESIVVDDVAGLEPPMSASPVDWRHAASPSDSPGEGSFRHASAQESPSFGTGQPRRLDSGASSYISLAEIRRTHGDEDHYNLTRALRQAQGGSGDRSANTPRGSHGTGHGLNESDAGSPTLLSGSVVLVGADGDVENTKSARRTMAGTFDQFDIGILRTPKKPGDPPSFRDQHLDTAAEPGAVRREMDEASHVASVSQSTDRSHSTTARSAGRKEVSEPKPANAAEDANELGASRLSHASAHTDDEKDDRVSAASAKSSKVIGSINSAFFRLDASDSGRNLVADAASPLGGVVPLGSSTTRHTAPARASSEKTLAAPAKRLPSVGIVAKTPPTAAAGQGDGEDSSTMATHGGRKRVGKEENEEEEDLRYLTPKPSAAAQFSEDMPAGAAARHTALFSGSLNSTGHASLHEDQPASVSARAAAAAANNRALQETPLARVASAPVLGGPHELACVHCRKVFPVAALRSHEEHCAEHHRNQQSSPAVSRVDSLNSSHRPASIMLHETQRELEALLREEAEISVHRRKSG